MDTSTSTKSDGGYQPWLHDAVPPCHLKTLQLRSRDHAVGSAQVSEFVQICRDDLTKFLKNFLKVGENR